MISPPSSWVSNSFRVSEVDVELSRTGAGGLYGIVAALICVIGEKNDHPLIFFVLYLNL